MPTRRDAPPKSSPKGESKKGPPSSKRRAPDDGLEELTKKDLVARAAALGVDGAAKFTKVELVDEIRRADGARERGFLGKARDLLKGVVEKGISKALHVSAPATVEPETIEPMRGDGADARRSKAANDVTAANDANDATDATDATDRPSPVPTVTLAEIYASQGHVASARAVLRAVLEGEPKNAAAKKLLTRLDRDRAEKRAASESNRPAPAPEGVDVPFAHEPTDPGRGITDAQPIAIAAEGMEPVAIPPLGVDAIEADAFVEPPRQPHVAVPAMLDDAPFPARYGVDECVAMAVDPTTLYVYWEVRRVTVDRARRALGFVSNGEQATSREPPTVSTLRVLVVEPTERGPRVSTRDFEVGDLEIGEYFVRDLPPSAIVRAAIGLRVAERFLPMAHTLDVEAPASAPSPHLARELAVWSEAATRKTKLGEEALRAPPPLSKLGRPPGAIGDDDDEPTDDATYDDTELGLSSADLQLRAMRRRRVRLRRAEGAAGEADELFGSSDLWGAPSSGSWIAG